MSEPQGKSDASSGVARLILDALGRGDVEAFARLLHPEVEIHTARGIRDGTEVRAVNPAAAIAVSRDALVLSIGGKRRTGRGQP